MKKSSLLILFTSLIVQATTAQSHVPTAQQSREIAAIIDQYSKARENSDTVLLKQILTREVDQLVSTGEWRVGLAAAVEGMLKSTANSPGTRTLEIDKVRMVNAGCALVDCRYTIQNPSGPVRKMWSSFVVVANDKKWEITAIRNMLPEER